MRHLLGLVSLRHMRAARGRALLTLLGIMLGVSVVFAIDVINTSVMQSFRATMDQVAGKTALSVGVGEGVDEALLDTVRAVQGVASAAPLIQHATRDPKTNTRLMVLGIDTAADGEVRDYEVNTGDMHVDDELAFLNDPHAVIVTERYAKRTGAKIGDQLTLEALDGNSEFNVRGTLAARGPATVFGGDLLLMDIFAAQIAFGRGRRFDQIDVVPAQGVDVEVLKRRLERALAGKVHVTRPIRRSQEAERLMAGFKLGLSLIGLVAMFVGAFVVYNALAIAVVQRRQEIGIWRALGATRRQILWVFLGEGLVMGAFGSLAGLGFGMLLARVAARSVSGAISALYLRVEIDHLTIGTGDVIKAVSVGMCAGLLAAYFPARNATRVEPSTVMRKNASGDGTAFAPSRTALQIACGALALAVCMAVIAHLRQDYLLGYGVSAIAALAVGFLAPALASGVGKLARSLAKSAKPPIVLGIVSFQRNAGRNAIAIAAFGIGLANVVNTEAFASSMKYTTARWLDRSARADLMVLAGDKMQARIERLLPDSVGGELRKLPGVAFVDPYRMTTHSLAGKTFKLSAHELSEYSKHSELPVVQGDLSTALRKIDAGEAIAVSEAFVHEFHVGAGDSVTLQTAEGPRRFEVALIYVDYTSDLGVVTTTRSVYTRLWHDSLVDAFGLYMQPGASAEAARSHIASALSKRFDLLVLNNRQYRAGVLNFIEQSFSLMRATEFVAIVVAVLGIINTLLVSILDRRRELGVLKAIGADARQIKHMLLTEGALIGFASSIIGVCFGAVFSAYIVQELLRFQVGWQLSWRLSGWAILQAFALGQVVTMFAVWWPLRSARRVEAAEALQYE